jgi:hypothetical protein
MSNQGYSESAWTQRVAIVALRGAPWDPWGLNRKKRWTMTIQKAVKDFISDSQSLYHALRTNGEVLSDVDLVALREQLHLLDAEAAQLQELKEFESDGLVFSGRRSA